MNLFELSQLYVITTIQKLLGNLNEKLFPKIYIKWNVTPLHLQSLFLALCFQVLKPSPLQKQVLIHLILMNILY